VLARVREPLLHDPVRGATERLGQRVAGRHVDPAAHPHASPAIVLYFALPIAWTALGALAFMEAPRAGSTGRARSPR
jgi:hypothetical protein